MTLSVLIPAFNEQATIATAIDRVLRQAVVSQVIVVDDGSSDGTREILQTIEHQDPRLEVVYHATNRGKGAAVRSAIPRATAPITIIQDADLEYDPSDFDAVIAPIAQGRSNVVYGSRVLHPDNEYPLDSFRVGSFVVTQAANVLYQAGLTDEPTCYKAFTTEFLQSLPLQADGFDFCPEVTAWVRKRGEAIIEVPIRYAKRSVAEGKKIRWDDGLKALWTLLALRFR